jgi:hypothetical protein
VLIADPIASATMPPSLPGRVPLLTVDTAGQASYIAQVYQLDARALGLLFSQR